MDSSKKGEVLDQAAESHPLGRVGQPEDVGKLVLFLADNDRANWITGAQAQAHAMCLPACPRWPAAAWHSATAGCSSGATTGRGCFGLPHSNGRACLQVRRLPWTVASCWHSDPAHSLEQPSPRPEHKCSSPSAALSVPLPGVRRAGHRMIDLRSFCRQVLSSRSATADLGLFALAKSCGKLAPFWSAGRACQTPAHKSHWPAVRLETAVRHSCMFLRSRGLQHSHRLAVPVRLHYDVVHSCLDLLRSCTPLLGRPACLHWLGFSWLTPRM